MGCDPLGVTMSSPWHVTPSGEHGDSMGWDTPPRFGMSLMILWHVTPSGDAGHPMGYDPLG